MALFGRGRKDDGDQPSLTRRAAGAAARASGAAATFTIQKAKIRGIADSISVWQTTLTQDCNIPKAAPHMKTAKKELGLARKSKTNDDRGRHIAAAQAALDKVQKLFNAAARTPLRVRA